ncbi:MAG: cytochrome C [Flavobacteriales bacterium]
MEKNNRMIIKFVLVLFTLAVYSCGNHGDHHGVMEKIQMNDAEFKGVKTTSDRYTNHIQTIEITEGDHTFLIPERKSQIQSFECSSCHTSDINKMKEGMGKKAHWNMEIKHANANVMTCLTCHNGDDMNTLKSITGQSIDMNLSYKVCSQCHTTQFEDWKGGAHGKKLGGWSTPRVSNSCVNCHNPHSPSHEKKWPAWHSSKKAKQRQTKSSEH